MVLAAAEERRIRICGGGGDDERRIFFRGGRCMCEFGTFRARFVRLSVVACDDLGFYTKFNPHEILGLDPRYLELIKSNILMIMKLFCQSG